MILIFLLSLSLLFANVATNLEKSPRIVTKDGNLIFEAGLNRNISIRLNGNSRVNINDKYDLLDLLQLRPGRNMSNGNFIDTLPVQSLSDDIVAIRLQLFGATGLDGRLRRLQNRTRNSNNLMRRTQTRLRNVENRVQEMLTKLREDNCKSNPCENGGTCVDMFEGFMCKCTKEFEGPTCSQDVNECALYAGTDLGCQNGGQCINQFGGYSCICNAGWFGVHCTQRKANCAQSSGWELCGHGTCITANDNFGYKCICDQGWKSNGVTPACNVDVDECSESHPPCATKCINLQGSFTCAPCTAGLTGNGLTCRDVDECEHHNGGCSDSPFVPCINTYGSYHCGECPLGWSGDGRTCVRNTGQNSCSTNNNCHPLATCTEISNTVVCTCPAGLVGTGIGPNGCAPPARNRCSSNPCLNGGTCIDVGGSFSCICPIGFRAPNCVRSSDPCASNPCKNLGRCTSGRGNVATCQCTPGYTGPRCELPSNRCGGILASDNGTLKYPPHSMYDHNSQCSWIIRTNATKVLNITFTQFNVEDSAECRFDWLQMNDGRTAAAQVIGRFCGSRLPMGGNIISSRNQIYLWFRSDNSTSREGFELHWTSIDPVCGGYIEFASHGTIASPGSPGPYPPNRDCRWHLKGPNDKRIKLIFFTLQIERHTTCNHDFLEITDKISSGRLEIFCNSSNPAPLTLPSSEIEIYFHSDNEGSDAGFQIHYSTVESIPGCGGFFTEQSGTIKSPAVVQQPTSCEYSIKVKKGFKIRLEFNEFKMGPDDCVELVDVNPGVTTVQVGRWCGEKPPPPYETLFNAIQVHYKSKGGHFSMRYTSVCSYLFESKSGVIRSPEHSNSDSSYGVCTYQILAEPNQIVVLNFMKLNVSGENEMSCSDGTGSTLKIIDGYEEESSNQLACPNTTLSPVISSSNMLTLKYKYESGSQIQGFIANYSIIPGGTKNCGGIYRKPNIELRVPLTEAGVYEMELECRWTLIAPIGYGIQLLWTSFQLEESTDCSYDYIEVYDSAVLNEERKPVGKFCGSVMPPAIHTLNNVLTLKFVSDSSLSLGGFVATFNFIYPSDLCGGHIFSSAGKLTSPLWPASYPANMNCTWVITAPQGRQIDLRITFIDLELSEGCAKDWLEIRNGGSWNSSFIGKYCGRTAPQRIPSFTHQLYLNFRSDSQTNGKGFQVSWDATATGCGGYLNTQRGTISSPYYPLPYPNDAQCDWQIKVNEGSTIHIRIDDMEMETMFSCAFDHLEIFDGVTMDTKLARICELDGNGPEFVTTGSAALIRFTSDSTSADRGFFLSYHANCTRTLTASRGAIESPNFSDGGGADGDSSDCEWTIQAPRGNRIAIDFAAFHWNGDEPSGRNATTSGLYLFEDEVKKNVSSRSRIRRIQGASAFESTTDRIRLALNSSAISFRLEYVMTGCIEIMHRAAGSFQSPNHPNAYPNDVECLWEIETDYGSSIELTFSGLDIEDSENCTKDGIEISYSRHGNHTLHTYCGKHDNITLTSSGHRLFVRFYSDAASNGKGFSAKYRMLSSACGGRISANRGTIISPNYPQNYRPNLNCEWLIEVSNHHTMTITIEELDIEEYGACEMDVLEAYDGGEIQDGAMIFRKCGQEIPNPNNWTTITNRALIVFNTDYDTEFKGFKLTFEENCYQTVLVDETIGKIRIVKPAQSQVECIWLLLSEDVTQHVVFTTTHVQLSPLMAMSDIQEEDCRTRINGVTIFDGIGTKTPVRQKFCTHHPEAVISHGRALTVRVSLNVISEFEGFYSLMDSTCGGDFNSIRGKFSSPLYPASYPVDIECIWTVAASEGNSVTLTIQVLDMEQSDGCNGDYLEVREGSAQGPMLGVFCGADIPPTTRSAKSLWIKFSSDHDMVGKGFIAEYNYVRHNEVNGTSGYIESPKYPTSFRSTIDYSWRITLPREYLVVLAIEDMVDTNIPYVKIYDGYSEIGAELEYKESNLIQSHTNVVFLKASRGPFRFRWNRISRDAVISNRTANEKSAICGNELLTVGDSPLIFNSPGYPNGYKGNLNCSWIMMSHDSASHVMLRFLKVDLEDVMECMLDSVTVSTSSDSRHWKELAKLCKKKTNTEQLFQGTPFLKLDFVTDYGVNRTGFSSLASSRCGSNLTEPMGYVNVSRYSIGLNYYQMQCIWQIHVQRGRRIKITFPESEFTNANDTSACRSYILLKNGFSEDSPFLGVGKYCNNNIVDVPETTSNYAYIKFVRGGFQRFRLSFRYEQVMHSCSGNLRLDEEGSTSAIIETPNYPNIPNPHTECIWKITAPINRVIAVNFVGRFDVAQSILVKSKLPRECDREYVQLNDGGTELAPMIGRFCGPNTPDTQYSSGNILRVKFFTDLAEPHIKFTANVSLGACGGTYYAAEGVIMSPRSLDRSKQTYCDYNIVAQEGNTLNLTIDKINLPHDVNCSQVSHLQMFLASDADREEENIAPELICGDLESINYILDENEVKLRYKILDQQPNGQSFRISYKSIGSRCGETIETEGGILQSPEYPNGVKVPTHCFWKLRVPKGRRIKIEFIDFDTGYSNQTTARVGYRRPFRGRIAFANDFLFHSVITRLTDNPPDAIYSTDNTMAINSFVVPFSQHRGFKLHFSSDEESPYCRETFDFATKPAGVVKFERTNASAVYCNYDINFNQNETLAIHVTNFQKNSSDVFDEYFCQQTSPLIIQLTAITEKIRPDLLCGNDTSDLVVRLPFAVSLAFSANTRNKMTLLEIEYKLHKCGGVLPMEHTDSLHFTQPQMEDSNYGRLECAWVILPSAEEDDDEPFELELSVDLKMKCDQEYLIVYNGYTADAPHLGRFCNQASASNLVTDYGLLVEYFTAAYQPESKFNVTAKLGSGCGGTLTYPFRRINFRQQYRNNVECIWNVKAQEGYHIGLTFVDRFYIESSPNCVKDYVKVQHKLNSEWQDIRVICGRESPTPINSTSSEMRLIFRSDADVTGDGFTAIFERNCGGMYYATDEKRTLSSPNYPFPYGNGLMCKYTILPSNATTSGIIVRFVDFQIEDTGAGLCIFDKVIINTTEVTGEETSIVLCGRNRKQEVRSRSPITILFQSDSSFNSKGFLLEYGNDLCGGVVTTPSIIGTPRQDSTGHYPPNLNCIWNITAPLSHKIVIKFELLDFEGQMDCPFDYVQVFAGRTTNKEKSLAKLCGNLTGKVPPISIAGNEGIVHSLSDYRDSSMGFRAAVAFIRKCDGEVFLAEANATYVFEAFAGGYKDNMDCSYVFRTSPGRQIRIEFSSFHVEESDECRDDFLEIRDGSGPFADEIERFCGHSIPPPIMSSKAAIFTRFVSDSTDTSSGFSATISSLKTICGNSELEVTPNKSLTLLSPGSGNYLPNLNCYWRIKGVNNIHLQFEKFDLQDPDVNGTCTSDSLKVYNHKSFEQTSEPLGSDFLYNGEENKLDWTMLVSGREHLYCGHHSPDDYYSNSKEIFMKLHTDSTIEKSGFVIKVSDASGCFKNYTSTQGRITIDTASDCDVFINAPQNYSISLFYGDIYFSESDCDLEYIEVFDVKTNSSLQKICQYVDISKSLFSNLNHLRLRIKNSAFYTRMDITYLASSDGPGCGGNLYNYEGVFTNPHYPQNVRNNSNCRWDIRVPNNLKVFLRFEVFDLGAKTTCHSDYLQIIEHEADGRETVARQFCGEDNPKVYMGRKNYLTVYFHKTVNYDGTGWVLRFSGVHQDYVIPTYFLQ